MPSATSWDGTLRRSARSPSLNLSLPPTSNVPYIDFNCDLGEGCGDDASIIPHISSASIACGAHAGDTSTMRTTLLLCRAHGVSAGAHPGYADRAHFGRREIAMDESDISRLVEDQVRQLATLAREAGMTLSHVKPHGALYNLAARDRRVADAVAAAIARVDRSLIVFGLSGSELTSAGEAIGLKVAHEVFAERGYGDEGRLMPRDKAGAVLESLDDTVAQARRLATAGQVTAASGRLLNLAADTLCLHGDRADAAAVAQALRGALERDGVVIKAPGDRV